MEPNQNTNELNTTQTADGGAVNAPSTMTGEGQGAGDVQKSLEQASIISQAEPVGYDFSNVAMPEGWTLDNKEQGLFLDVIKDMKLSNDQAGSLVKYGTEYAKRIADGLEAARYKQVEDWGTATFSLRASY